jgi:radical SAM superfamily enzyme YgiQ (UPF0313 family)/protein-L-isoaspartate O-methyltransferase
VSPAVSLEPAVLLISPGILKWTDQDFGLPHLVSMGSYVKHHTGVRVEILDLDHEGGDHVSLLKTIASLGPLLLVGVSCYSSFDYRRVMGLAAFLREHLPDVPLVTGGYHASAVPDELDFDGSPFDAVVIGEGEEPLRAMVETLLGGGDLPQRRYGPGVVANLDDLPPNDWSLLNRYWPRATALGRKLQVVLSRGCPYHCTFCMERSKSGYSWRAHSPERALDELSRLATFTDLSRWVVNIADPLFGFKRAWRREVLQGVIDRGLVPRAFWTLTRSDDLEDEDIDLLARARFSIGIGLESGSPSMLRTMQKGNTPERYLGAVQRLADRSQAHGLTWAVNVIVGHPGETPETMRETADFVTSLFQRHDKPRGWLSVDPFRLYPGSAVHQDRPDWESRFGAKFHNPVWWKGWYDLGFHAQHLDPSATLPYAERVRNMHDTYGPLVQDIQARFQGQGRSVDAVYRNSLRGQVEGLSVARRDRMLALGKTARTQPATLPTLRIPLGLQVKDPWVRRRELAVRRLLDRGVLRTEALIEALLQEPPERYMPDDAAEGILSERPLAPEAEGLPPMGLRFAAVAMGLEALEPDLGQTVVDLAARGPWMAALLARLVGPDGRVVVQHLAEDAARFATLPLGIEAVARPLHRLLTLPEDVDRMWLGAALPRFPKSLAARLRSGGRAVTLLGPRFRAQDLVVLTRDADAAGDAAAANEPALSEKVLARFRAPVLAGPYGWIGRPTQAAPTVEPVRFGRRAAPALCFQVLSHLDLGVDAANLYDPSRPDAPWVAELARAYQAASGRLHIHMHALPFDDVDAWLWELEASPPPALQDDAGLALIAALAAAVRAEALAFLATWDPAPSQLTAVASRLVPSLQRLRERLYAATRKTPPPLLVLDCPGLGRHARARTTGGARLVACSLAEPEGHVLMQLLHEETHPLTDPLVRAHLADAPERDTRVGTPGHAVHQELESVAVAATGAFLTARAAELVHDFEQWKARVGG